MVSNQNVRFLLCTVAHLHRKFIEKYPKYSHICYKLFSNYIPKQCKPARRDQDKCDDCLELKNKIYKLKQLRKKLLKCGCLRNNEVSHIIYDYSDNTPYLQSLSTCDHIIDESPSKEDWLQLLDHVEQLQYHRDKAHAQREAYKKNFKYCQTTSQSMLMIVDWKENYVMKGGTVATGRDFCKNV